MVVFALNITRTYDWSNIEALNIVNYFDWLIKKNNEYFDLIGTRPRPEPYKRAKVRLHRDHS